MSRAESKRRRRRLALIGGVFFILVAGVMGRYLMVRGNDTTIVDSRRVAGLEAYAQGDHAEAVAQLTPYVATYDRDAEALYALANARRQLVEPDGRHLLDAVTHYRQLLRTDPGNLDAASELLSIFMQYPEGVESEALKLADRLLEAKPGDPTALRSRAVCLARVGDPGEAFAAAEAYLELLPTDVQLQRIALDLLKRQSQPPAALLTRTQALREAHRDDPRFELVEAYAHLLNDDRAAALPWLDRAAQRPPTDRDFILQLVQLMDAAGRFPKVLAYLEKAVSPQSDPVLVWELARRRFEAGHLEEAHAAVRSLSEDRSLAMHTLEVIALTRLGRLEEARAALDHIDMLPGSASEAARSILRLALVDPGSPQRVIDAGLNADAVGLRDPYLDALIAQAYGSLGKTEQAVARYELALKQRPSWAGPCLGLAQLLLERGEHTRATAYAVAATQRRPESASAFILTALAAGADPASLDQTRTRDLLALIDRIQDAIPGEPRTLVLRVSVLAERGRHDEAVAAARAASELDPPLAAEGLLQLADTSRRYDLGLEDQLQQLYIRRHGQTPQIAMVHAMGLAEDGGADAAVAAYDAAAPSGLTAEWAINRALLIERLGRDDATTAWTAVGEGFPHNAQVQRRILRSGAAWQDRAFIARTIDRLREVSGDDDPTWRTERARLLLSGDEAAARAREADQLLDAALTKTPDDPAALLLRAAGQRLLDRPRQAAALLERAIAQTPDDPNARLELATIQLNIGERANALTTVRGVLTFDSLSADHLRLAAHLLIDLEARGRATAAFERLVKDGRATPHDHLALAQLYRQADRPDEALALLEDALRDPTPLAIAFAADLYARTGRTGDARRVLSLLDGEGIPAADAAAVRAAHAASHGSTAEAEAAYAAATELDPADARAWRRLVGYQFRTGRAAQALDTTDRALAQVPDDAGLAAIKAHADTIARLAPESGLTWLWLAMLEESAHRDAAITAMRTIDQARSAGQPFARIADVLAEQADAHPDFEGLQIIAVTAFLSANQPRAAVERAADAMTRFPASPRSAQLAAEAWAAINRWSEALLAAEAWAQRTPGDRVDAHLLAALAHRQLGRPDAAVALLETHRDRLTNAPLENPELTRAYALALAAAHKPSRAREVLEPLLPEGAFWRLAWLDVVVAGVTETAEAGRWLETVTPLMSEAGVGDFAQRVALAQAWWAVGVRDSFPSFMERARQMGGELAAHPRADASLWFFVGTMAEVSNDPAAAAEAYRKTLELDPSATPASNNLAMVLAADDTTVAEAVELARRAVAAQPAEPNYQDTLAFVLTRWGDLEGAEAAIREAIALDPGNPQWQRRLSEITSQRQAEAG